MAHAGVVTCTAMREHKRFFIIFYFYFLITRDSHNIPNFTSIASWTLNTGSVELSNGSSRTSSKSMKLLSPSTVCSATKDDGKPGNLCTLKSLFFSGVLDCEAGGKTQNDGETFILKKAQIQISDCYDGTGPDRILCTLFSKSTG